MTAPNAELAYRVLDHIDAHPEQWNQKEWHCGTAACFAGWVVQISGGTIRDDAEWDAVVHSGLPELAGESVPRAAESLLGLPVGGYLNTWDEHPFDPGNTRADLGRMVAEIFGPRPHGIGGIDTCRRCNEDESACDLPEGGAE